MRRIKVAHRYRGVVLRVGEVAGGELAALGHDLVVDALAFVQRRHAGALDRADVNEHILRAVRRGDEAEAFLRVEELDGTCGQCGLLLSSSSRALTMSGGDTSEFWGVAIVAPKKRELSKADKQ